MAMNILNNALNAREAGFQEMETVRDRIARNRAGRALASGDYTGAKAEAYGAGALDIGSGIQELENTQQDRELSLEADRTKQHNAQQKRMAETLAQLSTGLLEVPAGKRKETLDKIAPYLAQIGADPSVFQGLTEEQLTDENLRLFGGQMEEAAKGVVMAPGSQLRDPKTGKLLAETPFAPSYQKVSEGETLLQVGGSTPSSGSGSPRNQRNNNPGNIEDGEFARSLPGYKGSDGRFAIFENPDAGRNAQVALLQSYGRRGINTVSDIINRWAPPTDNNPTTAYAQFVAQKLGVDPGQPLDMNNPQVLQAVAGAIEQFEGGGQSASNEGGPRVLAQGKPKQGLRTLSPQEVQAAGFLPGTVVQAGPDGKLDVVQSPNNQASPRRAEADLRKEFNARPEVKEYREIASAYRNIEAAARNPSAANDLSLIFSYMKMLDPTSVVREGEFATAQNAAGIPDRVRNLYNRAASGQRLNDQQRADFVASAGSVFRNRKSRFDEISSEYRSYASDYGVDPNRVVTVERGGDPQGGGRSNAPKRAVDAYKARFAAGKIDKSKPQGDAANPFLARDMATAERLPKGSHVILPDGSFGVVE